MQITLFMNSNFAAGNMPLDAEKIIECVKITKLYMYKPRNPTRTAIERIMFVSSAIIT